MHIIMHVDMNSYFATAEQQANPFLRGKAICIAGKSSSERTVCAALSVEAKKFGLKSGVSVWEARQNCPSIIIVPADYSKYQFISRQVFTILEQFTPLIEIFSIDEAFLDLTDLVRNTEEAKEIAYRIKSEIRTKIGDYLSCSIGISHNKILAKLASEMQKPDGLTVINHDNLKEILQKTPVEDLCGIGPKLTRKLNLLGLKTLAQLGECDPTRLSRFLGANNGKCLHLWGQGIDNAPVTPYYEYPSEKSFGHSYTLPKNIFGVSETKQVLLKLAEKVGRRLRRAKVCGRTVHLFVRFFDFSGLSQQITVNDFINNGLKIYEIGLKIMRQNSLNKPIRALGISVTNIVKDKNIPQSLLAEDIEQEQLIKAADIINDRYGEFTLFRASLTTVKNKIENIPDGRNKRIM